MLSLQSNLCGPASREVASSLSPSVAPAATRTGAAHQYCMGLVLLCLGLALVPAAAFAEGPAAGTAEGAPRFMPARLAAVMQQGASLGVTADLQSQVPPDSSERERREQAPACPSSPRMDTDLWGTDGIVNVIVREGRTVYIGGTFTSVSASTGNGVPLGL